MRVGQAAAPLKPGSRTNNDQTGSPGLDARREHGAQRRGHAFPYGHQCKTQIEYTLQEIDPDAAAGTSLTKHIVRIAFQIEF